MSEENLTLSAAIKVALERGETTGDGIPNVSVLKKLTGETVKAEDRDAEIQRLVDAGEIDLPSKDEAEQAAANRPKAAPVSARRAEASVEQTDPGPVEVDKSGVQFVASVRLGVGGGRYVEPGALCTIDAKRAKKLEAAGWGRLSK